CELGDTQDQDQDQELSIRPSAGSTYFFLIRQEEVGKKKATPLPRRRAPARRFARCRRPILWNMWRQCIRALTQTAVHPCTAPFGAFSAPARRCRGAPWSHKQRPSMA